MIIWVLALLGSPAAAGRMGPSDVLGWAPGPRAGRVLMLVGAGCLGSGGVQGLESVPRGDDVGGPTPAGWDLEDSLAGVGDVAGGGAQQPEPQGLGFGSGELSIEGELA